MKPLAQRPLPAPGTPLRQALELLYDGGRAHVVVERSRHSEQPQLTAELNSGRGLLSLGSEQTRIALRPWCGLALDRPVSPVHLWRLTIQVRERIRKARKRAKGARS